MDLRSRSGLTLVETAVAALALGLLFMTLAQVVSSSRKSSVRTADRLSALSELSDFSKNLSEAEYFRSLALIHPDSAELKNCLENGCPIGNSGTFALDGEDFQWALLKPTYSWRMANTDLVKLTVSFPEGRISSASREISFFHSRKDFLNSSFPAKDSSCGTGFNFIPNVVAGIDTENGRFLCRTQHSGIDIWENTFLREAEDVGGQQWQ